MRGRCFAVFVSGLLAPLPASDQTLTSIILDHKRTKCTARLTTTLSLARIWVSRESACANACPSAPSIALNTVMVISATVRGGQVIGGRIVV